jgi:phosphomannomutase
VRDLCKEAGIEVFEVEVGETNVLTKMHQLEREGYFVPLGVEAYNGGTILFGSEVRDGTLVMLLLSLCLSDKGVFAQLKRLLGERQPWGEACSLYDIWSHLPSYRTIQGECISSESASNQEKFKLAVEEVFERKKKIIPHRGFLLEDFPEVEFVAARISNSEETMILKGRGKRIKQDGGFKIVLIDRLKRRHFIWFRGSKTELGLLRTCADSPDTHMAIKLAVLEEQILQEASRICRDGSTDSIHGTGNSSLTVKAHPRFRKIVILAKSPSLLPGIISYALKRLRLILCEQGKI